MEGGKSACKQGKKKTTVSAGVFNGGGIGGVVILGGALAAAALIAFFAKKRNRGRPRKKDQTIASESSKKFNLKDKSNPDEESEGLQLLVQPSPPSVHLNPCCKSNGTSEMGSAQMGPNELISTQNSVLDEISVLAINGGKETIKIGDDHETILSEITNPENISLGKDNGVDNQEYTLPELEISYVLEEEVNKINDAGEEPPLLETIEEVEKASETVLVEQLEEDMYKINDAGEESPLLEAIGEAKKEEGAFETLIAEQVEENPPMKSVEGDEEENNWEKEEDENDDESEEEESEESSAETGDSSMDSNAEAIWPAESIEKLSLELKEMKFNHQNLGEKIGDQDRTFTNDSSSNEVETTRKSMVISDDKETIKFLTVNDQPVKSGKSRMLILSILGTVLLLLMLGFLTHHAALVSYLINRESVL